MLKALLRTTGVTALLWITACQLRTSPEPGQSSDAKRNGANDAGWSPADRVKTASGGVRSSHSDSTADANAGAQPGEEAAGGGRAARDDKPATDAAERGASGTTANDAKPADDGEREQADNKPAGDKSADTGKDKPAGGGDAPVDASILDASIGATPQDAGDASFGDAGERPTVADPIGVLVALAERSPQGKTAETINNFLKALQEGDAPATSIRDFLLTVDSEVDCKTNSLATECLAACQAVSATCAVCVLDEMCRMALLDICGLPALAGCVPRR